MNVRFLVDRPTPSGPELKIYIEKTTA